MVFFAVPSIRRKQHNAQRKEDLGRFLTAINSYSSNNGGEFPSKKVRVGHGYYSTTIDVIDVRYLVENYIDPECKYWSGGNSSLNFLVDSRDNCSDDFRAPDNNLYSINPYGGHVYETTDDCPNGNDVGDLCLANDFRNGYALKNEILIYRGFSCGETEGTLYKAASKRTFALMMALDGGSSACVDND